MKKHVSLALNLRDGFRNRPIGSAAGLHFALDGERVQPVVKPDGWCAFINLPQGAHRLQLTSRSFAPLCLSLEIDDPDTFYLESYHTLSPTPLYPFGRSVSTATLTLSKGGEPLKNTAVLVGDAQEKPLKLAQDNTQAGAAQLKLFSPKKPALLLLPCCFLIEDKDKSELCTLLECDADSVFTAAAPLRHAHARSASIRPVREYATDEKGELFVAQAGTDAITLYLPQPRGVLSTRVALEGGKHKRDTIDFKKGGEAK